jgi:type I restriction enzyme, S subunit
MSEIEIPKDWELKKISDIGNILTGSTPDTTNSEYYGVDFPFYSPSDLDSSIEISRSKKGLSKKGYEVSRKIPKDSILVQCIGDLGKCNIIKKDGACNQQINVIIPNYKLVIPKFVYFWIKSAYFNNSMKQKSTKTTLPILNKSKFMSLPFFLPSIKIQKKIVEKLENILKQLEEKRREIFSMIEQNNERINFFEKNWFSYMIDNIIEKHPQRKEWKKVTLESISELITKGSSPKWQGINYVDDGILFITSENIGNGKLKIQKKKYVEIKFNEIQNHSILKKGDLLTNIVGAGIGRSALFDLDETANINQAVSLIRLKENVEKKFILNVLQSSQIIEFMHGNKVESARPNLSLTQVRNFPIPLPSIEIQKQIVQNIKNTEEKFKEQKTQFEKIKQKYQSRIKYINHIQPTILDSAFSGKLVS